MRSAYLMAAMPMRVLFSVLARNGVSIAPRYIARLAFLLQSGAWSSLLALREKALAGAKISSAPVVADPVIIVGHWRTGSTLLHQLMSVDPQFVAPTLFQVCYPDSFVTSRPFVEPVMKRMLLPTRPMDNVALGMDVPVEEEDALFRMCGFSPLERLIFARGPEYFLLHDPECMPPAAKVRHWELALQSFVTKLGMQAGARVLLKNPFHSMRIPALLKVFPGARFIHIYRDPHIVVPSTVRMWSIVGAQNAMRRQWKAPRFEDVTVVLERLLTKARSDLSALPEGRYIEIRFEELESRPLETVRSAYEHLGLDFTPSFRENLRRILGDMAGYRKNTYTLSAAQTIHLRRVLRTHLKRDGYPFSK